MQQLDLNGNAAQYGPVGVEVGNSNNSIPNSSAPNHGLYRHWSFTLQGHEDWQENDFKHIHKLIRYMIVQKERAPSTGKIHWQGYMQTVKSVKHSVVRGWARWHIEATRNIGASIAYCQKEDTRVDPPIEWGKATTKGQRNDILSLRNAIIQGKDFITIADDDHLGCVLAKYTRFHDRYRQELERKRFGKVSAKPEVVWIWGATGVGKTKYVHDHAIGEIYIADMLPWWDGYNTQENILLDDFRADQLPFQVLLRLLDRYPMTLQVKCSSRMRQSPNIWITAPCSPEELFNSNSAEDITQLTRRIDRVINLT